MSLLEQRLKEVQEELDSFDWKSIKELCSYDDEEEYLNLYHELKNRKEQLIYQIKE